MISARAYKGVLYNSDDPRGKAVSDALVIEHPLQIIINGQPLSITMQTPGDEIDLVRGLLYSEDIFRDRENAPEAKLVSGEQQLIDKVELTIPQNQLGDGYRNSRQLLSVASCGICGRTEFIGRSGSISDERSISPLEIASLIDTMRQSQKLFEHTGGCHGAAAFDKEKNILALREDIGRHNAVDKVIGALLLEEKLSKATVLAVSGRVSYEIVSKCFMAGIPQLVAVSAPSSLAVDFAKELGVQLFAFARSGRATQYA